ncbi:hypothetical protein QS257_18940 [Terrilactibacillus sp. S3-3]|nr:hypothetical protein QS257_18940 [Terrilactibacillus sp. S3-3]
MINIASIGTAFVILIILATLYLSFKNVKKSVNLYLFLLFLFPYSWSFTSVFHLYLQVGSKTVDLVELLFLYVFGLALATIIHQRAVHVISRRQLQIQLLWLLTILIFFVVGLLVNPVRYVFADMRHLMYFGSIFFLITFIQTKKEKGSHSRVERSDYCRFYSAAWIWPSISAAGDSLPVYLK